jgi:hypothetical protein
MMRVLNPLPLLLFSFLLSAWLTPASKLAAETTEKHPPSQLTLPRTGQISTYDQAGKLIDFQGSGQDGEFQRGMVWPDPRFIINRNGTVSDAFSGLMWLKDGNCFDDLPWPSALKAVADFNQGEVLCHETKSEYHDWFLPDLNQLAAIIDAQAKVPIDQLRLTGFTNLQSNVYWTATPYRGQLNAWGVDFSTGAIDRHNKLDRHLLLIARVETLEKNAATKATTPAKSTNDESAKSLPQLGQRFSDNGDGTVTDAKTGLMWLQDASCLPKRDWQKALTAMTPLTGGQESPSCAAALKHYADWSLPNAIELRSLIDYEADYLALSSGHLFQSVAPEYWTSTSVAAAPEQAFMVDFNTGAMLATKKAEQHPVLAVRQAVAPVDRPRKESEKSGNLGVADEYVLALDPTVPSEILWPPKPRFFNNGDGTSLDAITGTTWLTDANCFGKKNWKEAAKTLKDFSANPKGFKCADYETVGDNWQLPTLADIKELINPDETNSAAWLNQQGVKNVQENSTYWTATETPLNLYFADAISLKTGKAGNYPKSLQFTLWPKRQTPMSEEQSTPLLTMTANTIDNTVTISPGEPISLAVYLHPFGSQVPADFWFWYDTPDGKQLWLTHIRTWSDKAAPVYQGPLFNLKNYEIYRSVAGLAPGEYTFHFAIDPVPNGIIDDARYEAKTTVLITDPQE